MGQLTIPVLVIGLFVAFGVGFLVGANGTRAPESPYPANWNPAQAIISDISKASEQRMADCYNRLFQVMADREKDAQRTAH